MSANKKAPVSMPSLEQVEAALKNINYKKRFIKTLLSTISILIVVAAAAVLVSTLFLVVVQVSGDSMEPTFKEGDILVLVKSDKASYGDLCCVSWQNKTLLKRVIGLPGDVVTIDQEGDVYVNDELLDEPYVSDKCLGDCDIEFPFEVPDNKIFLLGDQRSLSADSRRSEIGCVGNDQIVGHVLFKVWSGKKSQEEIR